MSSVKKPSGGRTARVAGALAAAAALLGAPVAAAGQPDAVPARPYGKVIAGAGVNERQFPSMDSSVKATLPYKATAGLRCKVRAQNVSGNTVWYRLRGHRTWVSARYVDNVGYVPYCKDVLTSKLTNSKEARQAMG